MKRTFIKKLSKNLDHCDQCGLPVITCICEDAPEIVAKPQFWLLTHGNETGRPSNTGRLIKESMKENTEIFVWARTEAPERLIALLKDERYRPYLIFPTDGEEEKKRETEFIEEDDKIPAFIILDATWKEARKMLRKSPYLQNVPVLPLEVDEKTNYTLRRNSDFGHICTVEVAIELLELSGETDGAKMLQDYFKLFLKKYQAGRNGHGVI